MRIFTRNHCKFGTQIILVYLVNLIRENVYAFLSKHFSVSWAKIMPRIFFIQPFQTCQDLKAPSKRNLWYNFKHTEATKVHLKKKKIKRFLVVKSGLLCFELKNKVEIVFYKNC